MYERSTVETVIREALKHHEDNCISPALLYDQPDVYDLRTHDEDGFPGDFVLGRNKLIEEFTEYERILRRDRSGYDDVALNEFCIVESELGKKKNATSRLPSSPRCVIMYMYLPSFISSVSCRVYILSITLLGFSSFFNTEIYRVNPSTNLAERKTNEGPTNPSSTEPSVKTTEFNSELNHHSEQADVNIILDSL